MIRKHVGSFLLTSAVALGISSGALAQPANDAMRGSGGMHGMHGGMGMRGGGPLMHLRALNLTEAQRDQIFKIHHEQMPAVHEQMKQVRKARTDLRQAANADKYDEARVRQLADAQAKAMAALAVMHAQSMHRVREILTPEQRQRMDQMQERRSRG